jgi:hypothetical protein
MSIRRFARVALSTAVFGWAGFCAAQIYVTTYHNDNARTGQNLQETILTTSNVNSNTFGRLFTQPLDGYSYGQPLYVPGVVIAGSGRHNVIYVTTMNDSVYALDADSNKGPNAQPLWKVNFTDPAKGITTVPRNDVHCTDPVTAEVGIMSTPVIDVSSNTIYVLARTLESGLYFQRLHALDITSGAEKFGGPVAIKLAISGTGAGAKNGKIAFDPRLESQRSALLLQNGLVYIAWSSLCDYGAYHGWLMAFSAKTLALAAAWMPTPNGSGGGIWQSGDGPAGDSSFNTFTSIGNGTFDANSSGLDYGESVVRLAPPAGSTFAVTDYFTPYNYDSYNSNDLDIAATGLVLLPDQTAGPVAHLLVQGDKNGDLFVINRDNMGHFNSGSNSQIVQYLPKVSNALWSSPSWWNNFVYVSGLAEPVKAFAFNPSTGLLSTAPVSTTKPNYPYPGATVSISSNQNTNGIVWAMNNAKWETTNGPSRLDAYDATNLATKLYSSNAHLTRDDPGPPIKFAVPTIANGKVYVATQAGLAVFGLLN